MTIFDTDQIRAEQNTHNLPDKWLGARVSGWMFSEAKGSEWWICAVQTDGKWRYASFPEGDACQLHHDHRELARKVCRFLNRECSHGGAWLAGWIGQQFYMLWKDADGDIQIPIECPVPFERFKTWEMNDFAEHAEQAHRIWMEWHYRMEYGHGQRVKLAQGERLSAQHAEEAQKYSLTPTH